MKRNHTILRFLSLLFTAGVGLFSCTSCYYDSEEYLFPEFANLCDTVSVSYSGTVQPLLEQFCLSCHGNSVASSLGASIRLEEYSDVLIRAEDGSLLGSISHTGNFAAMPRGAAQLSSCSIAGVRKWIDAGSLNN